MLKSTLVSTTTLEQLWNDELGVIISAELVFVLTILVIGMIVGLSEVQHAVVQELADVSNAIGHVNQSFYYSGFRSFKTKRMSGGIKANSAGSAFFDRTDDCDNCSGDASYLTCIGASAEASCAGGAVIGGGICGGVTCNQGF